MTTEKQITEFSFFEEIDALASDLIQEYDYTSIDDDYYDGCHETADGHQWVIYTHKAQQVCNLPSSVTDAGEEWLEGVFASPYEGCNTYGEVVTRLAFAAMLAHLQDAVAEKLQEMEEAA